MFAGIANIHTPLKCAVVHQRHAAVVKTIPPDPSDIVAILNRGLLEALELLKTSLGVMGMFCRSFFSVGPRATLMWWIQ